MKVQTLSVFLLLVLGASALRLKSSVKFQSTAKGIYDEMPIAYCAVREGVVPDLHINEEVTEERVPLPMIVEESETKSDVLVTTVEIDGEETTVFLPSPSTSVDDKPLEVVKTETGEEYVVQVLESYEGENGHHVIDVNIGGETITIEGEIQHVEVPTITQIISESEESDVPVVSVAEVDEETLVVIPTADGGVTTIEINEVVVVTEATVESTTVTTTVVTDQIIEWHDTIIAVDETGEQVFVPVNVLVDTITEIPTTLIPTTPEISSDIASEMTYDTTVTHTTIGGEEYVVILPKADDINTNVPILPVITSDGETTVVQVIESYETESGEHVVVTNIGGKDITIEAEIIPTEVPLVTVVTENGEVHVVEAGETTFIGTNGEVTVIPRPFVEVYEHTELPSVIAAEAGEGTAETIVTTTVIGGEEVTVLLPTPETYIPDVPLEPVVDSEGETYVVQVIKHYENEEGESTVIANIGGHEVTFEGEIIPNIVPLGPIIQNIIETEEETREVVEHTEHHVPVNYEESPVYPGESEHHEGPVNPSESQHSEVREVTEHTEHNEAPENHESSEHHEAPEHHEVSEHHEESPVEPEHHEVREVTEHTEHHEAPEDHESSEHHEAPEHHEEPPVEPEHHEVREVTEHTEHHEAPEHHEVSEDHESSEHHEAPEHHEASEHHEESPVEPEHHEVREVTEHTEHHEAPEHHEVSEHHEESAVEPELPGVVQFDHEGEVIDYPTPAFCE